jgi:hypothetical protein
MAYDISYLIKAVDKFSGPLDDMKRSLNRFEGQIKATDGAVKRSGHNFSWYWSKIRWAAAALGAVGIYAIKNAEQFYAMELRLKGVSKNAAEAADMMAFLRKEAMHKGFKIESLAEISTRLIASKKLTPAQIKEQVSQLQTYALGAGADIEKISRVFGQAITTGKVRGMMLSKAMPILYSKMIEMEKAKYGYSDAFIRKHLTDIMVYGNMVKALQALATKDERFIAVAEEKRRSMATSLERMHESSRGIAASFGRIVEHIGAFKWLADKLEAIALWMDKISQKKQLTGEGVPLREIYQNRAAAEAYGKTASLLHGYMAGIESRLGDVKGTVDAEKVSAPIRNALGNFFTRLQSFVAESVKSEIPGRQKLDTELLSQLPAHVAESVKKQIPTTQEIKGEINLNINGEKKIQAPIVGGRFNLGYSTAGY